MTNLPFPIFESQYEDDFDASPLANFVEEESPMPGGTTPGASGRKGSMFSLGDITKAARKQSGTAAGLGLGESPKSASE